MRVASLDLIRGIAVCGILAINIAGFAAPSIGTRTPNLPVPSGPLDQALFAVGFVVFEGKMRALFAILFGASLSLFIARADERGQEGYRLQLKRLGWLLLFGALHYYLLWWGDILFAYAACGFLVVMLHRAPPALLAAGAVTLFAAVHAEGALAMWPMVQAEEAVRLGLATPAQAGEYWQYRDYIDAAVAEELEQYRGSFTSVAATKLRDHPFWPLAGVRDGIGEYLPLMLIGVVLQRTGFFSGDWPRRTVLWLGGAALVTGLAMTLGALAWLAPRGFPVAASDAAMRYALALPHLLIALGYAAILVLATPRLASTGLGRRLSAAGRMAFSNYIGTSLLMTAIFYGWGLGLFGKVGPAGQWGFVLLGWGLILAWSAPWLSHFRHGPLEILWRRLSTPRRISAAN